MPLLDVSAVEPFVAFLYDPNVVFLWFVVGIVGLYLEISHPGVSVPGIIGAISLVIFFFAVSALSPDWPGLALMMLAFVLLVLGLRFLVYGILAFAAALSLIVGTLLFFNGPAAHIAQGVDPNLVYVVGFAVGLIGFVLSSYITRARRSRVTTGKEGMIGESATVISGLQPLGRVSYAGENWEALLDMPFKEIPAGTEVQIVAVEGLRLRVRPLGQVLADSQSEHMMHTNEIMKEM